ncbi:iron chaperone [Streptomyces youssoufiensis]
MSKADNTSRDTSHNTADDAAHEGFTPEERAAMKEHAQELKKASRRRSRAEKEAEAAADVVAKIAEMPEADRVLAERVHAIVTANAPTLAPKLWYGMPAYALDGKVVCFFQGASKFKTRYATLGFSDVAALDEGAMWPAAYALTEVNAEVEARIAELVRRAVS